MKNKKVPKETWRTWIEINQQALKNNYSVFRRLIDPSTGDLVKSDTNLIGPKMSFDGSG